MDLIFLVDGSTSVGRRDFETTKEWIISFVKEFEIGEYNTKIGVVKRLVYSKIFISRNKSLKQLRVGIRLQVLLL